MEALVDKLIKYRTILLLLLIYFFLNLPNLTRLPIFNDESIYLDWGWVQTHIAGHAFDSLLDAKQPLMIWVFGIFEDFFQDPLFAGRFVSILIGAVSTLGIYLLTKKLMNKNVAIFATLLYSITPIFVFYNRQALMESAVVSVGIWSFYGLINLIEKASIRNGIILGIILGTGFLIKTSCVLFIVASTLAILFYVFKKGRTELIKPFLTTIFTVPIVDFPILANSVFWHTISTNSRYSYTLNELLKFPLTGWMNNLRGFLEISLVFITPFMFIFSIAGVVMMARNKIKNYLGFLIFFTTTLFLEVLTVRTQSQRYTVAFLSFIVISASYFLYLIWKKSLWGKMLVVASFFVPFILTLTIIFNPEYYILQLAKVSKYSEVGYVKGQISGYGIKETMQYIKDNSNLSQPVMVFFALNTGNPENAIDLYTLKTPNLIGLRIDSRFFPDIDQYECLSSKYPTFFVTRYIQLAGLDKFFTLEKSFLNPDGTYFVGIYTLKKGCSGKTLSLSDVYYRQIYLVSQMKSR
jgi:4-amino-4-deoxy-L-arabinose transferase-like glycosyltransferase